MAKDERKWLPIAIIGFGAIWLSLRPKKMKLEVITTKNRLFMLDDVADLNKLGLPKGETVKSARWK